MNVFFDTNVLLELLLEREHFDEAKNVADLVDRGKINGYISGLAFDTIIYVLDLCFKKKGMDKESRVLILRRTLNVLLGKFEVVGVSNEILRQAVADSNFDDIEDSCQRQFALYSNCEFIVSFNKKDFAGVKSPLSVMTPNEFCDYFSQIK